MNPQKHLVIFTKPPRLGRAKSRLGAQIGMVAAWWFYHMTLRRMIATLGRDVRWRTWLAITPDHEAMPFPMPPKVHLVGQGNGALGERMQRVMNELPHGPVIIIGSDIPYIEPRHIAEGFAALGNNNAVFGPAMDGGYWLVGLRRRPHIPDIFRDVRWSSVHALTDTLANLAKRGHGHALLEELEDVDDAATYERWRATRARAGAA